MSMAVLPSRHVLPLESPALYVSANVTCPFCCSRCSVAAAGCTLLPGHGG